MAEPVLHIVASHGLSSFKDLVRVGATTRALRAAVEQSLEPWRRTAERMGVAGDRLTKTDSQSVLLLSAKDLADVPYDVHTISRYREAHLYAATDVLEVALRKKHGDVAGLKRARVRRAQRVDARRATAAAKQAAKAALMSSRREELESAMRRLDSTLTPREDSRLCRSWIEEGLGSPDDIARVMLKLRRRHARRAEKKKWGKTPQQKEMRRDANAT